MKQNHPHRSRALYRFASLLPFAIGFVACERPEYTYSDDVGVSNGSSSFGNPIGTAGAPSTGGTTFAGSASFAGSGPVTDPCALNRVANGTPIFSKQAISNQSPARHEVYLQVSDAEAEQLMKTRTLVPKPASTPPQSELVGVLNRLVTTASELRRPLIQELLKRFKVTRATWANPWALRLVDHPGSEHMNQVRITFKKDAWIVRIVDGSPAVIDLENQIVPIASATAAPERIAAIYYTLDDRSPGTTAACENGRRELALGNEAMVEEFSLRTPEIMTRLDDDIAALELLFKVTRQCINTPEQMQALSFHAYTVCTTWHFFDPSTEYGAYQWALTNPLEAYKPSTQNLATLIQALKDDRFEPAPFKSAPNPNTDPVGPTQAEGGAGGEGAGGAAGAGAGGEGGAR